MRNRNYLIFFIGVCVAIAASIIGLILNDYNITLKITGFIVGSSFILSGILSGAFISGEMYRTNFLTETKADRENKMRIMKYSLLFSTPSLISILILEFKIYITYTS